MKQGITQKLIYLPPLLCMGVGAGRSMHGSIYIYIYIYIYICVCVCMCVWWCSGKISVYSDPWFNVV